LTTEGHAFQKWGKKRRRSTDRPNPGIRRGGGLSGEGRIRVMKLTIRRGNRKIYSTERESSGRQKGGQKLK